MKLVRSACSFGCGWMLAAPLLGGIYGFSALGDSSVYSTGITETVRLERRGSTLAVRSLRASAAAPSLRSSWTPIKEASWPPCSSS